MNKPRVKLTREATETRQRRSMALQIRAVEGQPDLKQCSFSSETAGVLRYDYDSGERLPEILLHCDQNNIDLSPVRDVGSILLNHDANKIVGAPVEVAIDTATGRGHCTIRFGKSALARECEQNVNDGTLRGISFGYDYDPADVIRLGRDAAYKCPATGREFKGPALLVQRWSVHEITLTPVPADPSVGVGRSKIEPSKENNMNFLAMVLALCRMATLEESWGRSLAEKLEREKKTTPEDVEKAIADEKATRAKQPAPAPAPVVPAPAGGVNEVEKERNRASTIRSAVRAAKFEESFADEMVDSGETIDGARAKIIAKLGASDVPSLASRGTGAGASVGEESSEKLARHMEASIAHSMRYAAGRSFGKLRGDDGVKKETVFEDYLATFKGVETTKRHLCEHARAWLQAIGFPGARSMSHEQLAHAIFSPQAQMRSIAGNTTASLTNILANVQNKLMLKTYRRTAPTWQAWCRPGNLSDFKAASRLRMSDMADLKETGENGEIFDSQVSDEKETIQLANYARLISFTWESFVNDDLDALASLTIKATQAAARLPSRLVYTHLLANPTLQDGVATFHATHANLDTTASALSSTNLNTAYKNIQRQTSFQAPNDSEFSPEPLDLEPRVLLVPPELREIAMKLTVPNPYVTESLFFKDLNVVIEPRLSNANYTGYSTTAYYVFCSPEDIDTCEVAFLDGDDSPRMQSMEDFRSLAMLTRVYLPCAVKMLDYRGAHKSNGA